MATIEEASVQILKEAKRPLHYTEIAKKILEKGLTEINSKTPELSIHVTITNSIKNKEDLSPFSKTDQPGFFTINSDFDLEKYQELGESMSLVKKGQEFEGKMKGLLEKLLIKMETFFVEIETLVKLLIDRLLHKYSLQEFFSV